MVLGPSYFSQNAVLAVYFIEFIFSCHMRCAAVCLVRAKNEKGTTHTHMHLAVLVAPTPRLDPTAVARWLLLPPQRASCAFSGHGNQSIAKPPPAATPTGMVYLSSGAAIRENPEPDAGAAARAAASAAASAAAATAVSTNLLSPFSVRSYFA